MVTFINPRSIFHYMIKNFKLENIGPCVYNFRLGKLYRHKKTNKVIDVESDLLPELEELKLPYIIKPGEYIIGKTIEEFDTPLDLMSLYAMRSIGIRIGLNIIHGINDPGYKGNAIFGIHNISHNKIKLFEGMELLQTAFVNLKGDAIPVDTKYMGGKIL